MNDKLAEWVLGVLKASPLLGVLLLLMSADIASGMLVAIARRVLNSTVSLLGMSRKALILILVGVAMVIEPHAGDVPLSKMVAGCFCATELLSILENAIALGVPVPRAFRDVLKKFADQENGELKVPEQTIVVKRHKRPSDLPPEMAGIGPPPKNDPPTSEPS